MGEILWALPASGSFKVLHAERLLLPTEEGASVTPPTWL